MRQALIRRFGENVMFVMSLSMSYRDVRGKEDGVLSSGTESIENWHSPLLRQAIKSV